MNSTLPQTNRRRYPMLNKVMVIGRLVRDAEVRYLESSGEKGPVQLTTFALAVDGAANYGQDTAFLDFSHIGEFPVVEHLTKGRLVYVEGHITQQRKEIEGQKRTFTNFQCERLQLLSAAPDRAEEDTEELLPVPSQPVASAQDRLIQALVQHYGPIESWSGKQVNSLIRWIKDKSGIAAARVSLEGFQGQISQLSPAQSQELLEELSRAFTQKSA